MAYDIAFQAKILPALTSALATTLGSIYANRVYAIVAPPTATFPLLIYTIRDGSGRRKDTIGANGWEGQLVLRSVSTSLAEANSTLIQVCEALPSLSAVGLSIQVTPETPQVFPIEKGADGVLYTVGVIVRIQVNQS